MSDEYGNEIAPEGQVFVCGACGKRSRDMYGYYPINRGWDESCMLNSFLCYENKLVLDERGEVGCVRKIEDGGIVDEEALKKKEEEREAYFNDFPNKLRAILDDLKRVSYRKENIG